MASSPPADLAAELLLDPDVIDDPYPLYRALHSSAPVWALPGTEVHVVSSFATVAEATSRVEDFSSNMQCLLYRDDDGLPQRLSFGDAGVQTLATADPPLHTLHRQTVFPALVEQRMAALEPDIAELAHEGMDRILAAEDADFMQEIGNVVPFTIVSRLIGFRAADPAVLLQAAFDSTELLGSTVSLERLQTLIETIGDIAGWIARQIAAAVGQPAEDILGAVARGVADGVFGEHEGTVILHTLLSAGGESTTSLLGNAVRILAEQPDLQERLRHDPGLIPAFVEEALRLESPFRYLMRSVPNTTELGGVTIPEGATVLLFWGAANRDPAKFDHPEDVDLGRRLPKNHVAFGRGIHHCVGAPLARREGHTVLAVLLDRTSRIELDPDRPPRWVDSLLVRRHDHLHLRLTPR